MKTNDETKCGHAGVASQYTPMKTQIYQGETLILSVGNPALTHARRCVMAKEICAKLNSFDALRSALERMVQAHGYPDLKCFCANCEQAREVLELCKEDGK